MYGGTKTNAKIIVRPDKITKIYSQRAEKAFRNELRIYKLAKAKRVNFIPKLLDYDEEKRTLVIANVGISLDKLAKQRKVQTKTFLPEIKKLYEQFRKVFGMHHNDLRYKNIVYNPKQKRFYLIDFEFTSDSFTNKNHQHILSRIGQRRFKLFGTKKKSKNKKRRRRRTHKGGNSPISQKQKAFNNCKKEMTNKERLYNKYRTLFDLEVADLPNNEKCKKTKKKYPNYQKMFYLQSKQPTSTYNNILKIQKLNNLPFKSELKSKFIKARRKRIQRRFPDFERGRARKYAKYLESLTPIGRYFIKARRKRSEQARQAEQAQQAERALRAQKVAAEEERASKIEENAKPKSNGARAFIKRRRKIEEQRLYN